MALFHEYVDGYGMRTLTSSQRRDVCWGVSPFLARAESIAVNDDCIAILDGNIDYIIGLDWHDERIDMRQRDYVAINVLAEAIVAERMSNGMLRYTVDRTYENAGPVEDLYVLIQNTLLGHKAKDPITRFST